MNNQALFTAEEIADWFLAYAEVNNITISATTLQKLLYFAWAEYSLKSENELFDDDIQALKHGPAVCSVLSDQDENFIVDLDNPNRKIMVLKRPVSFEDYRKVNQFLVAVWNTYGVLGSSALVEITHNESPWIFTERDAVINKALIRGYYNLRANTKVMI